MAYMAESKTKAEFQIYSGLTDPVEFFRQFSIYAMLYDWNDGKQVTCLKLMVKGKAEAAYNAATTAGKTLIADYIKFITDACQLNKEQMLRLFRDRKMHENENIRDYAQALNMLLKKAMPTVDVHDLNALVQSQLIANVPVELKPMLTMASAMGATQFNNIIDTLTAKTDRLIDDLGLVKQEAAETYYTQTSSSQNNKPNNNYSNNRNHNNNISNGYNKSVQFDGNCLNCNQYGHRIAFCPTMNNQRMKTQTNSRNQYQNQNQNGRNQRYNNNFNNNRSSNNYSGNRQNTNQNVTEATSIIENQTNDFEFAEQMITKATEINFDEQEIVKMDFGGNNKDNLINTKVNSSATAEKVELLVMSIGIFKLNDTNSKLILKRVLIDGGSTHSWIKRSAINEISNFAKHQVTKEFLIESATTTTSEICKVITVDIDLNTWSGTHKFIVSNEVKKYDAVLGRDFFTQHKVIIDHGKNSMLVDGNLVPIRNIKELTNFSIEANNSDEKLAKVLMQMEQLTSMVYELKTENTNRIVKQEQSKPEEESKSFKTQTSDLDLQLKTNAGADLQNETIKNTAVLYKVIQNTIIPAKTQGFVELSMVNKNNTIKSTNMVFDPFNFSDHVPDGCLLAKSLHSNLNNEHVYCNIINASDKPITFKADTVVGQAFEVEEALNKFNEDIKKFQAPPKNYFEERAIKRLQKLNAEPLKYLNWRKVNATLHDYLTTDDIIRHEIKQKLNTLKFNNNLTRHQQAQLLEVIINNSEAFQWHDKDLGSCKLAVHAIPTGDNAPIVLRQYQIPNAAKDSLLKQVDDMKETKVIRDSNSTWRSPVLLIRQKNDDGSVKYRFCIDLRKVNAITAKDCYALPLIQETVNALNGSKYFTTMDVDRAFWQIPVLESDKKKLAFCVDGKLYEFNVMPFGSMNAPSTFQRLIDRVLRGLTWKQCLVYIDDVLVFSKTFEQHLLDLNEVLNRFTLAGLKLKPAKCNFGAQSVEYLGYKISQDGIKISTKKLEAIAKLKPPETNKLLYSFLCSIKYYHSLVPKITDITADLFKMAEERKKVCVWTPELIKKFELLKQTLITSPVLAFPNHEMPFVIQTDASNHGLSGVLLQLHGNLWKPIAFFSRKLTKTESKYSATEREMLAVRDSYRHFVNTVMDRDVTFLTDHEPLVTAHKLKNPMGRLASLFNDLSGMRYKMEWIKGKDNHLPDFLSRANVVDDVQTQLHITEIRSSIDWAAEQQKDENLKLVKLALENNWSRNEWFNLKYGKRWYAEKSNLYLSNNILLHTTNKIVCPHTMKDTILFTHHDAPTAGHRSAETTLISVRDKYYWFNMATDIANYCSTCNKCQMFNSLDQVCFCGGFKLYVC